MIHRFLTEHSLFLNFFFNFFFLKQHPLIAPSAAEVVTILWGRGGMRVAVRPSLQAACCEPSSTLWLLSVPSRKLIMKGLLSKAKAQTEGTPDRTAGFVFNLCYQGRGGGVCPLCRELL